MINLTMLSNIITVYIFLYSMITCEKQLNIVWRDEFEGQALDRDKWDVDNEFAKPNCKG